MINSAMRKLVEKHIADVLFCNPWIGGIGVGFDGNEDCIVIGSKDRSKTLVDSIPKEWLQFRIHIHHEIDKDEIEDLTFD